MKKKILVSIFFIILVLFVTIYFFIFKEDESEKIVQEKVYAVNVLKINSSEVDTFLNYTGTISPEKMENITYAGVAKIEDMYVEEGNGVVAGQNLFKVNEESAKNTTQQALASQNAAQSAMNASKTARDGASRAYESAKINYNPTENQIAQAELNTAITERNEKKKQLDTINEALTVPRTEMENAKKDVEVKTEEYAKAVIELAKDPTNATLITDKDNTKTALDTAETTFTAKELEYTTQETQLNKNQIQAELATLETQVQTKQAKVDLQNNNINQITILEQALKEAQYSYDSSVQMYESAKLNYIEAQKREVDCVIKASFNGYVLKLISKKGEIANPLTPVMVIGSNETVVNFGVSQSDIRVLEIGDSATVTVNGKIFEGEVNNISVVPDETSRTYQATVLISDLKDDFYIGELASIKINIGEKSGVWLPLSVILNDGDDYVYIVKDNRAVKTIINITDISNDKVCVTGLNNEDVVIVEGMKTVRSGSSVNIGTTK